MNILLITKKFDLFLVINDFKLVLDEEYTPHLKSKLPSVSEKFNLERYLLLSIEKFTHRRHKVSYKTDMNFTSINPIKKTLLKFFSTTKIDVSSYFM